MQQPTIDQRQSFCTYLPEYVKRKITKIGWAVPEIWAIKDDTAKDKFGRILPNLIKIQGARALLQKGVRAFYCEMLNQISCK